MAEALPIPRSEIQAEHVCNVSAVLEALERVADGDAIPLHLGKAAAMLLRHHGGAGDDQLNIPEMDLLFASIEAAYRPAFCVLTPIYPNMWAARDGLMALLDLAGHWAKPEPHKASADLPALYAARDAAALFGTRCLAVSTDDHADAPGAE
jgi:hypothetical protein